MINNSWGCPPSEGCTDPNVLLTVVQAVRAAGIVTVHSAGNSGSVVWHRESTPAAIYDESFSVGATTSTDAIASFSSRGPVTVDGSNRLKPDVSAPGSSVRSAYLNSAYTEHERHQHGRPARRRRGRPADLRLSGTGGQRGCRSKTSWSNPRCI